MRFGFNPSTTTTTMMMMMMSCNACVPGDLDASEGVPNTDTVKLLEAHRPIKMGIILVLGAMITLGNVAVVSVIYSAVPGWSRNSRYLLLSLTGADSAFGLVVMPLNLCVSLLKDYSDEPDPFCHVVAFFNATVYSTCMYTLASISLERYVAVFYPLQYSCMLTRRRALALIAFAWIFPPVLLVPITCPVGIIDVHFSTASLVCNPSYSSNVTYSLTLTAFIFFPCSALMTFCNLRLWVAARTQRRKLRRHHVSGRWTRPNVASRVLVPVMTAYFTCWTPCMVTMIYTAISGSDVPEWVEFVAVWLPTSNGFLNCIFYFWINQSFRRKFHSVLHRLCFRHGPDAKPVHDSVIAVLNNNTVHERSSSVSSTCTLLTGAVESYN